MPEETVNTTVNPYRKAASLAFRRLAWDLSPVSWEARRRLRRLRDTHLGEKSIIMCNGPSLLQVDFDLLSNSGVFTFGLNKINLLFDKTEHRPSCIVAVNPFVIEQNLEFFNKTSVQLFIKAHRGIKTRDNVYYLHTSNVHGSFAGDVSMSLWEGHTVTYVAMQIAYHLGFAEVGLVGCDHSFSVKGPPNQIVTADASDSDHFDPTYFSDGMKWQLPDLAESEMAYHKALQVFDTAGRRLFNCTRGGKLEILPRRELAAFLAD